MQILFFVSCLSVSHLSIWFSICLFLPHCLGLLLQVTHMSLKAFLFCMFQYCITTKEFKEQCAVLSTSNFCKIYLLPLSLNLEIYETVGNYISDSLTLPFVCLPCNEYDSFCKMQLHEIWSQPHSPEQWKNPLMDICFPCKLCHQWV